MNVKVHETKTRFQKIERGEGVIAVVDKKQENTPKKRTFGQGRGTLVYISPDFDEEIDDWDE